jgi:hypothetical protein
LTTLPPARPAFKLHTLGTSPISGPLYRYDGESKSTVKFPPHFQRKWFVTDYTSGIVNVLTLDSAAEKVVTAQKIFGNTAFFGPVDFRGGPDGALYVTNYGTANFSSGGNTSIVRISYKGTCRPAEPKLETPTSVALMREDLAPRKDGILVNLGAGRLVTVPGGMAGFELYDVTGKMIWEAGSLKVGDSFRLPGDMRQGALKYRWIPAGR